MTILIIAAVGAFCWIMGHWMGSLKRVKVEPQKDPTPLWEDFDPLQLIRENENLKRANVDQVERLRTAKDSLEYYASKFKLLQKAARENNESFILYELQRMNYEEDKKTVVAVSGFSPLASSFAYHSKEINNGFSTVIRHEKPQLPPNREEVYY
jgi:hypothetical protein